MTYEFLQSYWWFLVSLLGALLVFLMFVQGANTLIFCLGKTEEERRLIINSTGRKWEFTFTTLVTFGGAFFASFPLFYSTSFGGAYWLWMFILFSFVIQAVSYEFQNKIGNFLGPKTFQICLIINGIVGPLLLGGAVATFFNGSNFLIDKGNITNSLQPVISRWANASHGLDALLDPWNVVLHPPVAMECPALPIVLPAIPHQIAGKGWIQHFFFRHYDREHEVSSQSHGDANLDCNIINRCSTRSFRHFQIIEERAV